MMESAVRRWVDYGLMSILVELTRALHVHWYRTRRLTVRYRYQECRCQHRRITRLPGIGYEPIDVWWLDEKRRPKLVTPKRQ